MLQHHIGFKIKGWTLYNGYYPLINDKGQETTDNRASLPPPYPNQGFEKNSLVTFLCCVFCKRLINIKTFKSCYCFFFYFWYLIFTQVSHVK